MQWICHSNKWLIFNIFYNVSEYFRVNVSDYHAYQCLNIRHYVLFTDSFS